VRPDLTVENVLFTVTIIGMTPLVFAFAVLIDHILHGSNRGDDK